MSERDDAQKVMRYDAERIVDEVIQERVDKAIYQLIGKRVKEATESLYDYVDNVVADIKTPNSPRGEVRYFGGSLIHNRQDSSSIDFLQAGQGAIATDLQTKVRQTKAAADFSSVPIAVADRITVGGGNLNLDQNTDATITSTLAISLPIEITGFGQKTRLLGSGITIAQLYGVPGSYIGAKLSDFAIADTTGNASTIGLLVEDTGTPTNGVNNFRLSRLSLLGTSNLGVGVKTVYGLKGVFDDVYIEGFSKGIQLTEADGTHLSNSNWIHGSKIRVNTTGISVEGSDDVFIAGCTIEGNGTGISQASGKVSVFATHFENTTGLLQNAAISAGSFCSFGNFYAGAGTTYKDIYISAGANTHLSVGDTLNNGIRHDGTGGVLVVQPILGAPTVSGTGPVTTILDKSITGTNQSGNNFVFSGFGLLDIRFPIYNSTSVTTIAMSAGNGVVFADHTVTQVASILESGTAHLNSGTAIPAGGTQNVGLQFSSTASFGVFFGSGAPTLLAAKGSLYLRSDGSSTSTRLYVNTDGSGTWTNVTTAA